MSNGLVQGHAYIVTKAAEVVLNGRTHRLMRLYNPWGNDVEWNGEWSDRSSSWNMITPQVKESLELKVESGEHYYIFLIQNFFSHFQFFNLT